MMSQPHKARGWLKSAFVALACVAVAAGVLWSVFGKHPTKQNLGGTSTEETASLSSVQKGSSGLPIPRFVSLKTEKVNVRKGPSSDHEVAWVFQSKGLPVEVIAEFETWRRIRDSEGAEGWILQNMLAGKRTLVVAPWKKDQLSSMFVSASVTANPVAELASGAMGDIVSCDGNWCDVKVGGYSGYVEQSLVWGAYPGEVVN